MYRNLILKISIVLMLVFGLSSQTSDKSGYEYLDYLDPNHHFVASINFDALSKEVDLEALMQKGLFADVFEGSGFSSESEFITNPEIIGIDFTLPIVVGVNSLDTNAFAQQLLFTVKNSNSLIKFFSESGAKSLTNVAGGYSHVYTSKDSLLAIKGSLGIMLIEQAASERDLRAWLDSLTIQASRKTSLLAKNKTLLAMLKQRSDIKVWFNLYSMISNASSLSELFAQNVAYSDSQAPEPDTFSKFFKDSYLIMTLQSAKGSLTFDFQLDFNKNHMDQRLIKLMQVINQDALKKSGISDLFMLFGLGFSPNNLQSFIQEPDIKSSIVQILGGETDSFDELLSFLNLFKGDIVLSFGGTYDRQGQATVSALATIALNKPADAVRWLETYVKKGDLKKEGKLWYGINSDGERTAPFFIIQDNYAYLFFDADQAMRYSTQTFKPSAIVEPNNKKTIGKSLVFHANFDALTSFFADSNAALPLPDEIQDIAGSIAGFALYFDAYQGNNSLNGSMVFEMKDKNRSALAVLMELGLQADN